MYGSIHFYSNFDQVGLTGTDSNPTGIYSPFWLCMIRPDFIRSNNSFLSIIFSFSSFLRIVLFSLALLQYRRVKFLVYYKFLNTLLKKNIFVNILIGIMYYFIITIINLPRQIWQDFIHWSVRYVFVH